MTRKTKRDIERKLDEMDANPGQEYPKLDTLAELLGYDWEDVESEDEFWRRKETGQIYYFPQEIQEGFEEIFSQGD